MQLRLVQAMHRVPPPLHEVFQALAEPYRLRIVQLMLKAQSEVCLCELSESLLEPEYKISRHLKVLKSKGLIESARDGKWIYHSLIGNQAYLKTLLKAVEQFPVRDRVAVQDFARFTKRAKLREQGRCRGSASSLLTSKTSRTPALIASRSR